MGSSHPFEQCHPSGPCVQNAVSFKHWIWQLPHDCGERRSASHPVFANGEQCAKPSSQDSGGITHTPFSQETGAPGRTFTSRAQS